MSKGGGGGGNQTSHVYQSSLPEYARPFYEYAMTEAKKYAEQPYQPYTGQRLAGQSAATTRGLGMASDFASSGVGYGLDPARSLYGAVGSSAMDLQNYVAGGVHNTYEGPERYTAFDPANAVGFGSPGIDKLTSQEFGAAERDKYMSPYMEGVIDVSQRDAAEKAMIEQQMLQTEAAKAGAFGGARSGLQLQTALGQAQKRISDIGVLGRQSAFENAQQQFERDQQRAAAAA